MAEGKAPETSVNINMSNCTLLTQLFYDNILKLKVTNG